MARFKHVLMAAAFAPLVILSAVACDDETNTESSASQGSIDAVTLRVQRDEMMYANLTIDSLELHPMSEALAEGTIETTFAPRTRTAIRLYALTDWDDSLAADAATLRGHAVDLLQALADEDIEAAAAASDELHDGQHEFSEAVWAVLAADLPADAGGVEDHEETPEPSGSEETESTPDATETQASDDSTPEAAVTP